MNNKVKKRGSFKKFLAKGVLKAKVGQNLVDKGKDRFIGLKPSFNKQIKIKKKYR